MAFKKKAKNAPEAFHFEERGGTMERRAEDFRRLGQEMAHDFDARMEFVANVKKETADLMKEIQARNAERTREVSNMLAGFRRENEAAATAWRGVAATIERKRAGKH